MTFFGSYSRNLDEKGRLLLPTALLQGETPKELYILRGFDGCLSLYLPEDFQTLMDSLKRLDQRDPSDRAYIRLATASMKELKVDSHGRILLGADTLAEYGFGSEVLVNGVLDHLEIWDRQAFSLYCLHNGAGYDTPVRRG